MIGIHDYTFEEGTVGILMKMTNVSKNHFYVICTVIKVIDKPSNRSMA